LPFTKVGDAGLVHLKGLTDLRQLSLHSDPITDEGLTHLKELTNLEFLDLDETRVNGTGLPQLIGTEAPCQAFPSRRSCRCPLPHP
jgi:hypothetical protein